MTQLPSKACSFKSAKVSMEPKASHMLKPNVELLLRCCFACISLQPGGSCNHWTSF